MVWRALTSVAESDLPGGGGPSRLPSPAARPGMPCDPRRGPALCSSELPLTTRHLGLECAFSTQVYNGHLVFTAAGAGCSHELVTVTIIVFMNW